MILAFAAQKGGVGKTTLSVCTAAELQARGASILLVDADPQRSSLTWAEVAIEAGRKPPTCVALGAGMHEPGQLPRLARDYEHVVIDCPPRNDGIARAALMVADVVILPCGPSPLDAWALAETVELVKQARTVRPVLRAFVCISKKQPRTTIAKEARDVLGQAGLEILSSEISNRVAYQEAMAAGLGLNQYAPRDAGAAEVRALADELLRLAPRPMKKGKNRVS